jgi:hypothetical protein
MKLTGLLIKSLIIYLLAFPITSCSDDNYNDCDKCGLVQAEEPAISLKGSWQMTSMNIINEEYFIVNRQLIRTKYSGVGKDFTYRITFNDDPKTYSTSGGYTFELQIDSAGQTFTKEIKEIDIQRNGTWTWALNGNSIRLEDTNTLYGEGIDLIVANDSTFYYDLNGFMGTSMGELGPRPIDSGTIGFNRL